MDSDSASGEVVPRKVSPGGIGCVIAWLVAGFIAVLLLLPILQSSHGPTGRSPCVSSLKQIGIALQNYHDHCGSFPPRCVFDADGKPMHSWRMLLLPYFEEERLRTLGKRYRLDEPWNSPHNWQLIDEIAPESAPSVFRCRSAERDPHETNYVAVAGDETPWPPGAPMTIPDMTDGTSRTICLVEIANSDIHWAEPRDLPFVQALQGINAPHVKLSISSNHPRGANTLFCDGSVHFLSDDIPPDTLRALLTAHGGENVTMPED